MNRGVRQGHQHNQRNKPGQARRLIRFIMMFLLSSIREKRIFPTD